MFKSSKVRRLEQKIKEQNLQAEFLQKKISEQEATIAELYKEIGELKSNLEILGLRQV